MSAAAEHRAVQSFENFQRRIVKDLTREQRAELARVAEEIGDALDERKKKAEAREAREAPAAAAAAAPSFFHRSRVHLAHVKRALAKSRFH